jgi:nucleoside-triphosphatase
MARSVDQPHVLLITGMPGVGKTTLIRKVAAALSRHRVGGFYTEEIHEAGERRGFRLVTLNHDRVVIAHVEFGHRYRVGKYGVDVAAIDRFADGALGVRAEIDVYLVDEIGRMECLSAVFVTRMRSLLDSDKTVIATVARRGDGLIDEAKHWPGSALWEITRANRDSLATQVVEWVQQRL